MTLRNSKIGGKYTVLSVCLEKQTGHRLEALGLTIGTNITILNNKRSGAVIFQVRGTRIAIGKEIAESIEVAEAA